MGGCENGSAEVRRCITKASKRCAALICCGCTSDYDTAHFEANRSTLMNRTQTISIVLIACYWVLSTSTLVLADITVADLVCIGNPGRSGSGQSKQCFLLKEKVCRVLEKSSTCTIDSDCSLVDISLHDDCCKFPVNKSGLEEVRQAEKTRDEYCGKLFPEELGCGYKCRITRQSICIEGKCKNK